MAKRGNGEGSIYQRSDGRWAGAVSDGWQNGKAKRKTYYGKTRREVAKKIREALQKKDAGIPLGDDRQTLKTFLNHWLDEIIKPTKRWNTFSSYRNLVEKHIAPDLGHIPLTKLSPQHVQKFLNRKREEGYSVRTVRYLRTVLGAALGKAQKLELVSRNVAMLVDAPRDDEPIKEMRPFTPNEARSFLVALEGNRLEALYKTAIALGPRQSEALGLRWSDIDLTKGTLRIRTSLHKANGKFQLENVKTKRSRRTIILPKTAIDALRKHHSRQQQERLKAGSKWKGNDLDLVFTTTIGTPLDRRNVNRHFYGLLEDANLPRIRFQDLRHTAATLLLVQGEHPRVVMDILGHSSIRVTMDTYSHVIDDLKREAAKKMDALLKGEV